MQVLSLNEHNSNVNIYQGVKDPSPTLIKYNTLIMLIKMNSSGMQNILQRWRKMHIGMFVEMVCKKETRRPKETSLKSYL